MATFRCHLTDGTKLDVDAETADNARRIAHQQRPGAIISKIKRVKEFDTLQDVLAGIATMFFLIGGGMLLAGVA